MNILIIGGGAGGMMAALTALKKAENHVTLVERQARVGRKLLSTGNGRCNLTNRQVSPAHYHGQRSDFCRFALEQFGTDSTLGFFENLGLTTVTESDGKVYPRSNMANSVLDVLRFAMAQHGEQLESVLGDPVAELKQSKGCFVATLESGRVIHADKVILCAGGCAGSKVGGVMDGYKIAQSLGHHRTALYPALVQIKTDPTYPRSLKGVKTEADITLLRGKETVAKNRGEILFTEYGVSGPAIFEISRYAAGERLSVELDLWAEKDENGVFDWLKSRRHFVPDCGSALVGVLHNRLAQVVVKAAGLSPAEPFETLTASQLHTLAHTCKHFTLPVTGTCGFDQAQVTAGGLVTDEFDPGTMQSRLVPGFYACGEVLDIDGDCGGFNLQWAWSSGHLAGQVL